MEAMDFRQHPRVLDIASSPSALDPGHSGGRRARRAPGAPGSGDKPLALAADPSLDSSLRGVGPYLPSRWKASLTRKPWGRPDRRRSWSPRTTRLTHQPVAHHRHFLASLHFIHTLIGKSERSIGVTARLAQAADTHARIRELEAASSSRRNRRRDAGLNTWMVDLPTSHEEHSELITSHSIDVVRFPECVGQLVSEGLQERVPDCVSLPVVDRLQTVEIYDGDPCGASVALYGCNLARGHA